MNIGPIIRAMNHNRTRFVLIMLEIAITLAIVTNCVNMILDERTKMTRKSGFDDENLVRVHLRPFAPEFRENQFVENTVDRDLRALRAVPGVKARRRTRTSVPWQGGGIVDADSRRRAARGTSSGRSSTTATPDMFDTLGTKITQGRGCNMADHEYPDDANASSVVISKALANLLFRDGQALGKAIQFSDGGGTDAPRR